ncbi:hypothetical protein SEUCBS140593_002607 [Sporothrix eucalyptigena]|uniref:Transcription factor n=1 Tax=Sporothrix eucalyptigena TaxID=1812306 RepID=A0ABP0B7Z7_9PEZI
MAHQGSFSSNSSLGSASPSASVSSAASGAAASPATVSFSVFQEGPGRPLVFAPPRGTPELQALVDLFIALDVPASMKMEMIQRDFEAHTARTNERYKTYVVTAPATPTGPATITSPSTYTASPSPIFHNVFDAHLNHPASISGGSGSGSGSMYLDASPAPRPSPTESDLTIASDSLFPLSVPMFSTTNFAAFPGDSALDVNAGFAGSFFPVTVDQTTASMWPATTLTATAPSVLLTSPNPVPVQRTHQRQSAPQQQRRRLSGTSSMQILTRTGEDVTHMSSRGTRTHEERENTRLVRQRGACPDCRRKKTRCNPDHAVSALERVSSARSGPYVPSPQSGRAKAEAAAAKSAKASKEKVEGKKAVTTAAPMFMAPQTPSVAVLAGIEDGGGGGINLGHIPQLNLSLFQDSFDWDQLSDQGHLFTPEDLELSIATTLSMAMPTTTTDATTSVSASCSSSTTLAHTDSSSVPPFRPPPPHRPTDARLQSRRNLISATTTVTATATTADQAPQMGRMANTLADFSGFSPSFASSSSIEDSIFSDSARYYSAVNASMTESCVQPGSTETGGLTHSPASGTSRSLTDLSDREVDLGDERGLERRGMLETQTGKSCEDGREQERKRERERSTETTRRLTQTTDREPLESLEDQQTLSHTVQVPSTSTVEGDRTETLARSENIRTTSTANTHSSTLSSTIPSAASSGLEESPALPVIASESSTSSTISTLQQSSSLSSSSSSSPPLDVAALLTGFAEIVQSLIPAYLAWTAAAETKDDLVSDMEEQLERMNLGPRLISCQ